MPDRETAEDVLTRAEARFEKIECPVSPEARTGLGYPAAYVAETAVYEADGRYLAVAVDAESRVDASKIAKLVPGASWDLVPAADLERKIGVSPELVSPLNAGRCERVLWDQRLRRRPLIVLPGKRAGEAIRVDTRQLRFLDAETADVAAAPAKRAASAYDVLLERGFVDRVTNEERARELLGRPDVAAYIGFDPTADSLHVGSLVPIMSLVHVQRAGGRVIAIVGGGTAMIGDPSGRTEMRKMLSREDIARNMEGLRRQLSTYLTIDDERHRMLDNAEWLAEKKYIDFLREVGAHFSVNRMLAAECFRQRLEKGLSFIEFNYMLLQAYDFVALARQYNCLAQMGGSDQWGNICAGIDLGRRMADLELCGVTFPLIQSASGRKFGKTEAGNVWLDAGRTSPHDFFQFWRNADDADVERFLGLFTTIPMDRVRELCDVPPGPALNDAKRVLAFATTRLLHGEPKALESLRTAEALFGGVTEALTQRLIDLDLLGPGAAGTQAAADGVSGLPTFEVDADRLEEQGGLLAVLTELGLSRSRSEARRLVAQGGVYLNDSAVKDPGRFLEASDFVEGQAMIRVGKKRHGMVRVRCFNQRGRASK